jgi:GNAT superfamily N-acetyltransferase
VNTENTSYLPNNKDTSCSAVKTDIINNENACNISSFKIYCPEKLDNIQLNDLKQLINSCGGYEPFYCGIDTESSDECSAVFQAAAYSDEKMIGFASCCFNELTALVLPEYRRRRVFTCLFENIKKQLNSGHADDSSKNTLCFSAPDFIQSLVKSHPEISFSHSEYLMECSSNSVSDFPQYFPDAISDFSDDGCDYLMYLNASDDEPCAVCSLDYQPSHTMLYNVFVDENLRGKKAGTFLLSNLIRDYFSQNTNPLLVQVSSTNIPAFKLYKNTGFNIIEQVDYFKISF